MSKGKFLDKFFGFVVVAGVVLCSILFLIFLFNLEYQSFTFELLSFYNKTDRIGFFRQNLLTETRFFILKVVVGLTCMLFSAFIFWKWKWIKKYFFLSKNRIYIEVESILKKVIYTWNEISFFEKFVLFIPLPIYIIFWWLYGWQNDEIFSYTFFVDRGILVCATYYPAPNNHVAFLIFSALLNKIIPSFFSDFICLKLPATCSAMLSLWIIWLFFYRRNQKKIAWFSFYLVAFSGGFFFYATHGRGYAWTILFFLWSCFAVFKIISNQNKAIVGVLVTTTPTIQSKKYWFLWAISLIFGCYTIPIFIYVWFGSLIGLWLIGTNKIRIESIIVSCVSGIIILFLYSPILIINGLSAIVSNSWVAPLSFEKWLEIFPSYLMDVHGIVGILAFIASFILFFRKKEFRKTIIYFWCIAYLPYLITFIQKVLPFERVFLYRQVAEILMLCFCVVILTEKYFTKLFYKKSLQITFISLAIFYASVRMYGQYYHWNIRTNVYQFAEPLAKKIYTQKPSSILVLEDTYNVFLRYYFRDSDTKVDVLPKSKTEYQIIILPLEKEFPLSKTDSLNYSIFYKDNFVKGFERK
ncbi:hypothetical protein WAF17_12185 [Bernardetia sp. ABR2-2B]|uniref:hypothetical protein n=1 Tax=Bernardetia sp. ABR2-2B TaxID=3127472 RepID=UPI0030CCCF72